MGFLGNLLFGKRDKSPLLVNVPSYLISGMDTLVYIHNSNSLEIDHITHDDIVEAGLDYILRQHLTITNKTNEPKIEEPPQRKVKKRNVTPVFYVEDYAPPRGRYQSR